jgi:hypothetical protein
MANYLDELLYQYNMGQIDEYCLPQEVFDKVKPIKIGGYVYDILNKNKQGNISDEDTLNSLYRITKKDEYIQDINQNRIKEKMYNRYEYVRYGRDPLEIILEWERFYKIIHFVNWIRSTLTEEEWYIFSSHILFKVKIKDIAWHEHKSTKCISSKLQRIRKKIKEATPYYITNYEDIYKYIKGGSYEENNS